MDSSKKKTTVTGGIYQDDKGSWHYYFGESRAYSGSFPTKERAVQALQHQFDQAIEQFGDKWEVTIERKDL